jgi:hypothetical protein
MRICKGAPTGTLAGGVPAHGFRALLESRATIARNACRTRAAKPMCHDPDSPFAALLSERIGIRCRSLKSAGECRS